MILKVYVVLLSVRLAGIPLMLFDGSSNEVLAVLIWYTWDEGNIESVAAIRPIRDRYTRYEALMSTSPRVSFIRCWGPAVAAKPR